MLTVNMMLEKGGITPPPYIFNAYVEELGEKIKESVMLVAMYADTLVLLSPSPAGLCQL